MAFRWFRRRRPPPPPPDPIAAYDDLVSDLDAEAAELRRAAATLLTVRARLEREQTHGETTARTLRDRAEQAHSRGDAHAVEVLTADVQRLRRQGDGLAESLARTEADVTALKEAASRVAEQVERLKAERDLAAARFTASSTLAAEAQRSRADRVRRLVAVDAARDEVERAHALAEVWREDADAGRS
jgi:phage shock protein A